MPLKSEKKTEERPMPFDEALRRMLKAPPQRKTVTKKKKSGEKELTPP